MTHPYPTRFQAKLRRAAEEKAALDASVAYTRAALEAAMNAPCYHDRIRECTKLFDHLYENPILLSGGYVRFRQTVWYKMNETERYLLSKLQEMPARLAENNAYDMKLRCDISKLIDLMESIRKKYW